MIHVLKYLFPIPIQRYHSMMAYVSMQKGITGSKAYWLEKKNIVEIVIISGKHTWPLLPMLNKNPVIRFLMIFFNDQKPFLTPQPTEL